MEIPNRTSNCRPSDRWTATVKPVARMRAAIRTTSWLTIRSYPNYAPTLVWKLSKEDNISSHLIQKDRAEWYIGAENIRCLATIRDLEQEAGFVRIGKLAQSWTFIFCHHEDRYSIEFQVWSLFQDGTASWVRIVNGIEWYVNETTETMEDEEHGASGNLLQQQDLEWNQH